MRTLSSCPSCGCPERTLAAEFNQLIASMEPRARALAQYDYSLCHGCGLLYAVHRPEGDEFLYLMENFNEHLGRRDRERLFSRIGSLPREEVERVLSCVPAWHEIAAACEQGRKGRGDPNARTRLMAAKTMRADIKTCLPVLQVIAQFAKVEGGRTLEIRAHSGFISHTLRTVYGAKEACATCMFPLQTEIQRSFGINARHCLDFETFKVPFEGTFDLIVANHMMLHVLNPADFLAEVRAALKPGGWLILYQEHDDAIVARKGESVFSTLRCFHFQQYDQDTLRRVLSRAGLKTSFIVQADLLRKRAGLIALATPGKVVDDTISDEHLRQRIDLYATWRARSLVSLPEWARDELRGEISAAQSWLAEKGYEAPAPLRFHNADGFAPLEQ